MSTIRTPVLSPSLVCTLRRRRVAAFLDAPSLPQPLNISDMVVAPAPNAKWTYRVARSRTLREWEELYTPREEEDAEQEQAIFSIGAQDKMGLFLSICSLLVSVQMFMPRNL